MASKLIPNFGRLLVLQLRVIIYKKSFSLFSGKFENLQNWEIMNSGRDYPMKKNISKQILSNNFLTEFICLVGSLGSTLWFVVICLYDFAIWDEIYGVFENPSKLQNFVDQFLTFWSTLNLRLSLTFERKFFCGVL
jgi:hypothetical protein